MVTIADNGFGRFEGTDGEGGTQTDADGVVSGPMELFLSRTGFKRPDN